jgi:ABC-type sugar transport system ATPase subunit
MTLGGSPWKPKHPAEALARGMVYVPEERKSQGFVLSHALGESFSIGFSDRLSRLGIVSGRKEQSAVAAAMRRYDIRGGGATARIGTLSGGNQQKALLARWLERNPEVLILDEPTRGVDVGAKAEIHALIDRLAADGRAILLISSDLPEILGVSDRILVMCRGAIGAELRGGDRTEHNILLAASGMSPDAS